MYSAQNLTVLCSQYLNCPQRNLKKSNKMSRFLFMKQEYTPQKKA